MDKWKGRYLMTGAVCLQAISAIAYAFVPETDGASLLFGIPLSIVSLMVFGRGALLSAEVTPPPPEPAPAKPALEEMILNLQEDVNRLREDREFYRELYAEGREGELAGVDRLPVGGRELTYRLVPERSAPPQPPSARR